MTEGKKAFYIQTFGCQMNVNDSEKVAGLLLADGLVRAEGPAAADFVFINTCAVRERASEKLFHALGRLRRVKETRPGLRVGVGGCVAQLEGRKILVRAPIVDILVGTQTFSRIPEYLRREDCGPVVDLERTSESLSVRPEDVSHSSPVRAFVTVMEGCNHVCSFCVVPRTRGVEVCRSPEAIVDEVRKLATAGYREVMLLGQTVNAYKAGSVDFAGLLELVHEVPGLERLRFTTSHPSHIGTRLAEALRDLPKVCPSLHLPVQSGSDRILASMRRGYTVSEYKHVVALLRHHVPDIALSSDVIAGYPGEGEADFRATVELVDAVGFEGLFVFAYSPRPGTGALRLGDDVAEEEKALRVRVLNERQQRTQGERNGRLVGSSHEVLVESESSPGRLTGRTRHFRIVHFDGPPSLVGHMATVAVEAAGPNALLGTFASDSLTPAVPVPIF